MKKTVITVLILGIVGLAGIGYLVNAVQDTTQLSQQITAGSLSITAPTSVSFTGKSYSFSGQNSTGNTLDNLNPVDTRGGGADTWTLNATCADWGDGTYTMDYDGDGSSTGQLTINSSSATCAATHGNLTGISIGDTESFGAGTSTITVVSASSGNGDGDYDCDGWDLQQFIPGSQEATTYTTTLTLDLQ